MGHADMGVNYSTAGMRYDEMSELFVITSQAEYNSVVETKIHQ